MLPEEIILEIFSFLEAETLIRCKLICKDWLRIALDDALWYKHCKKLYPELRSERVPNTLVESETERKTKRIIKFIKKRRLEKEGVPIKELLRPQDLNFVCKNWQELYITRKRVFNFSKFQELLEFAQDVRGFATIRYRSDFSYECFWSKGNPKGVLYTSKTIQFGKFNKENNLKQTRDGITFWHDGKFKGNSYEGEYSRNQKHGYGVYRFSNGDKYFGIFKNENKYYGKYIYKNGDVYVGYYKNDGNEGKMDNGYYIWKSGKRKGDVYIGNYEDGKRDGFGIYLYSNKSYYCGLWKDNKKIQGFKRKL